MPASISLWCAALFLATSAHAWVVTYVDLVPRPDYFVLHTKFLDGDQGDEMLIEDFKINAINSAAFAGKPKLKTVRIRDSQILNIDKGAFTDIPVLEALHITNSLINSAQLNPDIFGSDCCPNLVQLELSGNDVTTAHIDLLRYLRIQTLTLSNCSLLAIPPFVTRNYSRSIVRLDLSSNRLQNLDYPKEFNFLEGLKVLILRNNFIEHIQEDTFKPLKKCTTISLNNNRITKFSEKLFQDLDSLEEIDLNSNRIEHVPAKAFQGTKLNNLDLSGNRLTYLPDGFCASARNAGAALTTVYFDGNPWQCACLNDFLVEVKRLKIQYKKESSDNRYNGRTPVCVTSPRFVCLRPNEYYQAYDNFMRSG